MNEQGETRHGQLSCNNNNVGSFVSSVESHNVLVHQVDIDHRYVLGVQETQNVQQPNTSVNSELHVRHNRWLPNRWLHRRTLPRFQISVPSFSSNDVASEAWSCTIVVLTFWLFTSMILMLGFYGTYNIQLGPNCSYTIGANPFVAHSIKAQQVDDQASGPNRPILYGFYKSPSLDVLTTWSTTHNASIDAGFHREWTYYLNAGSRVEIHYNVKSPSSDFLSLVIAQGRETLVHWMDDPSYPNTTLSWNILNGSGRITQDITETDVYYIAVGNLNLKAVEVYLNITAYSLQYDTSKADFECYLSSRACSFKLKLLKRNVAVLTTPGSAQVNSNNDFYVQVSFGAQWITYCTGSCIVTAFILAIFKCCDRPQPGATYDTVNQGRETLPEREPLISPKSDQSSSMGSSYESDSSGGDDVEENNTKGGLDDKITKDGGSNSNNSRLCAICFDAPKDCFFVPCGHSAACFSCGSRIAEEAGNCPICRRKMKKVRKIFLV